MKAGSICSGSMMEEAPSVREDSSTLFSVMETKHISMKMNYSSASTPALISP